MEKLTDNNSDQEFINFLNNYDYLGLLDFTNQILQNNPKEKTALKFKAKALISLKKYEEANSILSRISFTPKLQRLEKITNSLITFRKNYEKYSQIIIPDSWYKDKSNEEVENYRTKFLELHKEFTKENFDRVEPIVGENYEEDEFNYRYYFNKIGKWYMKLHNYNLDENHKVYILGPESIVNEFKYFDYGICWLLGADLKYPFAQGMHDGWLFTKEQNFLLSYGFQDEKPHYYNDENSDGGPIYVLLPFLFQIMILVQIDMNKRTQIMMFSFQII
jgi:hypothetical protein